MESKKCFKCGNVKPLIEFYKHPKMKDGHVNKCISCNKNDIHLNYELKSKDKNFLEKERLRGREKYKRLNYKDRQKEIDKDLHWKKTSKYKNLNRKFKLEKGLELHHWNYNYEFLEDILILTRKQHKKAHKYLVLDKVKMIFKTIDGVYLDSKVKHIQYLLDNNVFNS